MNEKEAPSLLDRKRIIQTVVIVAVLIAAIYFLLPSLVGIDDALSQIKRADPIWVGVTLLFCAGMFFSYVALFRGVVGEDVPHIHWREAYEINLAGLAATRLLAAGGAGGIVLTYWALRKAGMARRRAAARMVAFLVLLYSVYMLALVVLGLLLYTEVLHGNSKFGLTLFPAILAGLVIAAFLLMSRIPADFDERVGRWRWGGGRRIQAVAHRLAKAPTAIASGTRIALDFVREPKRGGLAMLGAVGFWASQVGILWASFHAFDISVPLGVVFMGFFIGMVANLFPFAPGGVGAVDAGMIGTFVLFGIPAEVVFPAVLLYRFVAFWLPIPPGFIAFIQLRRTVSRWEAAGYEQQADAEEARERAEVADETESVTS